MTALDDELGPLAADLLGEFGKSVSLIRVTVGAYDPATSKAATTEAVTAIKAIVEDFAPYQLANGLASVGDKKLTVAAFGLDAPKLGDAVSFDGARYALISFDTVYSGELAALYILHGRKA